jgi:hypothetical protein
MATPTVRADTSTESTVRSSLCKPLVLLFLAPVTAGPRWSRRGSV